VQSLPVWLRSLLSVPALLGAALRPSPEPSGATPLQGWPRFFFLASLYALMILRWGYEYGRNDQMQTLAYAQMLADPTLYPADFYLRGIHEHVPNERFVFSRLLAFGAGHLPLISFVGHLLFSLLLLHGLDRIARHFVGNHALRWGLLFALFVPLYGVNLGSNELWYNSFFVSNVVKTLGIAGLGWLLRGHYWRVFAAFSAAAFLQPVVGIHLYGLASAALLLQLLGRKKFRPGATRSGSPKVPPSGSPSAAPSASRSAKPIGSLPAAPSASSEARSSAAPDLTWKTWGGLNALWLLSAGVWIVFLRLHFEEESPPVPDRFFDILFIFRAPHHYWPPSWSASSWLVIGTLTLAAGLFFRRRSPLLAGWVVWSVVACGLYLLGAVGGRLTEFGALQAFKVTIWLEFLGLVALAGWLEPAANWILSPLVQRRFVQSLPVLTLVAAVAAFAYGDQLPMNVPRDTLPLHRRGSAVDISLQALALSPTEACFAHPISFTELKVYGQRSSYVDYKVLVHTRAAMHRWYERIQRLYGLSIEQELPASQRYSYADAYFRSLSPETCQDLAGQSITHLLTFSQVSLPFPELCRNRDWVIYVLPADGVP